MSELSEWSDERWLGLLSQLEEVRKIRLHIYRIQFRKVDNTNKVYQLEYETVRATSLMEALETFITSHNYEVEPTEIKKLIG